MNKRWILLSTQSLRTATPEPPPHPSGPAYLFSDANVLPGQPLHTAEYGPLPALNAETVLSQQTGRTSITAVANTHRVDIDRDVGNYVNGDRGTVTKNSPGVQATDPV